MRAYSAAQHSIIRAKLLAFFKGVAIFVSYGDNGFHRRSISPWPQKKSRLRGPRNLTAAEDAIANEVSQMIHTGDYSAESGQSLLQRLLK